MAATSTSRTWSALARRALAASAVAATAIVALAVPASAHEPKFEAGCKEDAGKTFLKVNLVKYNPGKDGGTPNKVKVTDGDKVLADENFGDEFTKAWRDLSASEDHSFKIVVTAHDDPDGSEGWTVTWKKDVKACVGKEQPPTSEQPPPPATETEAPPASTSEAPPTTPTTTEVPIGANGQLAETGASIAIPAVIGGLLLVGGGVMLFLVRRRSKA